MKISELLLVTVSTNVQSNHCVKSVRIRSYSGPYFTAFGLNTERYRVSFRIQSECGKITPNMDNFHAVNGSFFALTHVMPLASFYTP